MLRALAKLLIARLPFRLKYEIFYQTSPSLGVTGYRAAGEQGNIFRVAVRPVRHEAVFA